MTAIPKKIPTKNQNMFKVIKYSYLSIIWGKYIVVSPKIIVYIIAIIFLFLLKKTEMRCPTIAPTNDITTTMIDAFGVLWNTSTPISNIFCPIAVDIARNTLIGRSNRMYFFMIPRILGSECASVGRNGLDSKS
ncbi:MAG: hypothetical protein WCH65_04860 [bacterium]